MTEFHLALHLAKYQLRRLLRRDLHTAARHDDVLDSLRRAASIEPPARGSMSSPSIQVAIRDVELSAEASGDLARLGRAMATVDELLRALHGPTGEAHEPGSRRDRRLVAPLRARTSAAGIAADELRKSDLELAARVKRARDALRGFQQAGVLDVERDHELRDDLDEARWIRDASAAGHSWAVLVGLDGADEP